MKNGIIVFLSVICVLNLLMFKTLDAQEKDSVSHLQYMMANTSISGQYFIAYLYNDQSDNHQFTLKRGYFTVNTKLSEQFSVRYTQDITLDQEGSDAGNVEMRLKFLYLKAKLGDFLFLKKNSPKPFLYKVSQNKALSFTSGFFKIIFGGQ